MNEQRLKIINGVMKLLKEEGIDHFSMNDSNSYLQITIYPPAGLNIVL